jgi:3-oxoacyl-[acyl-carrier protein] reductase
MNMETNSNKDLQNEISLVTGASRGIGASIADLFGQQGSKVIGTATSQEGADKISKRFLDKEIEGHGIVLDVSQSSQISQSLKKLKEEDLMPSILINNAGISLESLFMRIKDEDWHRVMETNLSSIFYLSKGVISSMLKKRHGRIINIGSVVGNTGAAGNAHYSAAKSGLIGLTKSLAREVGSRGITVNTIAPGYITTDMTKDISEELNKTMMNNIPLKRFGKPEDIAKAALYLASSAGSYITGQTLHVNGGMHME